MENEWITSETGTRTFRHEGWELTIFAHCSHQIDISAPNSDVEVDVVLQDFNIKIKFYYKILYSMI